LQQPAVSPSLHEVQADVHGNRALHTCVDVMPGLPHTCLGGIIPCSRVQKRVGLGRRVSQYNDAMHCNEPFINHLANSMAVEIDC